MAVVHDGAMSNTTHPTHRPLRRPIDARAFAGVASGLGLRFGVSPTWFRVAFVLMTVFGGIGVLLYILGWLLIPEEGSNEPLIAQWLTGFDSSNTGMVVGVVLVGVAVVILASSFHLISGKFVFAAILLVVGVLLYRGDLDRRSDPPDGGDEQPPSTDGVDGGEYSEPADEEPIVASGDVSEVAVETRVAPPAPARPPRPTSILGRLTVAATLMAVGGLAVLDVAGVLFPDPVHYVAVTVGIIGTGLLVGALFGRARWLIVVGLLLTPLLFVASFAPTWSINGEAGERYVKIETIEDLVEANGRDGRFELAAGSLHIDLSDFEVPSRNGVELNEIPIYAKVGAGEVRISLPRGVAVFVHASAGIGSIDVFGDQSAGIGVSRSIGIGERPLFIIEARAGLGSVVVDDQIVTHNWEG